MLYVVDSIMGSGKTSAAIQFINDHPEKNFIVITPFLSEQPRFQESCPSANFYIPSEKIEKFDFRKLLHAESLFERGENVIITHALFSMINEETCQTIIDHNYTIIIDEAVDVVQNFKANAKDLSVFIDAGYLIPETNYNGGTSYVSYKRAIDKDYSDGDNYQQIYRAARSHRIVLNKKAGKKNTIYYTSMYQQMFQLSKEIYLLTYIFEGSPMYAFFRINNISYTTIGVRKTEDGKYYFDKETSMPEYTKHLSSLVTILDRPNMNAIGAKENSLSSTWFTKDKRDNKGEGTNALRKHIDNFFKNIIKDASKDERLWTTFKKSQRGLRGKGYSGGFVTYTTKATNAYGTRNAVAYCLNVFLHADISNYFAANGFPVDQDLYALSSMLQFIWRSAIRNGEPITVYVPSSRMRNLLLGWMSRVEQGLPR